MQNHVTEPTILCGKLSEMCMAVSKLSLPGQDNSCHKTQDNFKCHKRMGEPDSFHLVSPVNKHCDRRTRRSEMYKHTLDCMQRGAGPGNCTVTNKEGEDLYDN